MTRLTVFGATGPSGRLLVQQALAGGHEVTAFARDAARIEPAAGLTVVPGELDDAPAVRRAVAGADAVISLLGPGRDPASAPPLVPGMQAVVDAMTDAGVRRLVATATPSAPDPADRPDEQVDAMVAGIRSGLPAAYEAIRGLAAVVRASGLDWTLVRLPLLHDGATPEPARPRRVGEPGGLQLSRSALAAFLLDEAETCAWLHAAPLLADR